MDIDELAPSESKYLKKEQFASPTVLTIRSVQAELMNDGKTKGVLYFQELPKGLVLNATKKALLKTEFGGSIEGWPGRKVRLSLDNTVMMSGKVVGGIKLECSKGKAETPKPAPAPAVADSDDNIPF
jgi:hypothetical protein